MRFELIKAYLYKIRKKSRLQKYDQMMMFLKPTPNDKFLEVGVADKEYSPLDNFIIKTYPYRENIAALGFGILFEFIKRYPDIFAVSYNGERFPFPDKHFNIAHANAVIEHVGDFTSQKLFLSEMTRVAQRGMITTPNKYFPIEIHTLVPFIHLCSKEIFDRFLKLIGKDWATGDYMNLLGLCELKRLIKSTNIQKYILIKNRVLGIPATFSLIWYS